MQYTFQNYFAFVAVAGVMALAGRASADLPPLSPEQMNRMSSHILTGKVLNIYTFVEKKKDFEVTHGLAEIQVGKMQKGKWDSPLVYVRFWRQKYTGKSGWVGPTGNHDIPKPGDKIRVFAKTAKDGGLTVLDPNGFAPEKTPATSRGNN